MSHDPLSLTLNILGLLAIAVGLGSVYLWLLIPYGTILMMADVLIEHYTTQEGEGK